jgi:hypothetical protein
MVLFNVLRLMLCTQPRSMPTKRLKLNTGNRRELLAFSIQ